MEHPDLWYDDNRQVGLDFDDEAEVATYDARQARSPEADRALLAELGAGRETRFADIGCGTGLLACEAAKVCRAVRAIDISAAMLAAAGRRAQAEGLTNISFEQAGFLSFDAPPASLDLITTKNALHHLPDFWKGMALVRMHAALRSGGRLYIRDVCFGERPAELASAVESWASFLAANTGYSRADAACHVREEHSTFSWVIDRLLSEAGFRVLERRQDTVYASFLAERS